MHAELPTNHEAERAVLGCLMLSADAFDDVAGIITAESFHDQNHARVFDIAQGLHREGKPVDTVSVAERLQADDRLHDDEIVRLVGGLAEAVPHASHANYYAGLVREKADRRAVQQIGRDMVTAAGGGGETRDIIGNAEQRLHRLLEAGASGDSMSIADVLIEMESDAGANVFPSGFVDVDSHLGGGLCGGWLAIMAARPGVGKTALAGNITLNFAKAGNPCLIFSLEQSRGELAERLLSSLSGVPAFLFKPKQRHKQTDDHKSKIFKAQNKLSGLPIVVNDTGGITVGEIAAAARLRKRRGGLALVVVDYLQLIEPDDKRIPREQQVAFVSRRLKLLAKELSVPVICLAQLNRGIEAREVKRPRLSDLRESGAIEQDADVVLFPHRPGMNDDPRDPDARLIVGKNRHGQTGDIGLYWDAATMTFKNAAPE